MEDPVRRAKEEFVSNLNGTSWVEIDSVLLMQPLCVFILSSLVCFTQHNKVKSRTLIESIVFYLTDFICSVIPLLLLLTVCADFMPAAFQATVVFVVLLLAVVCKNFNSVSLEKLTSTELPHNYISWYRAYVNVLTAICILAVDFRVYPRRLAKTETFGTGLMDIFVGAFIMCNSIVCKEATNLNIDSRKIREKWSGVIRTLQSSLPLTILGVARLVTTKASNYQEHTSEYGVHWNFFLTLALTRVACTVLLCLVRPTLSCVLSVSLAVSYQYLLSNGLQDYILRPGGRVDAGFISANREGIFSTIGYMSLYCAGVAIGQVIFRTRRKLGNKSLLCLLLFILSAVTVLMQVYADSHGYRVSRRLANLPFILWTIHHSVLVLAMMLAVSIIQHVIASYFNVWSLAETNSEIIDAVNYNGLLYFVLANLMTGAVNISTDTLSHSTGQSMVILTLYLLTLNTAVYLLYKAKIRTKFW